MLSKKDWWFIGIVMALVAAPLLWNWFVSPLSMGAKIIVVGCMVLVFAQWFKE